VRYQASGWEWLYASGVFPYAVAQRLLTQDEPDSSAAHRNNILAGMDVSWRVAPGTRLYGEIAVDDLSAETSTNPDKIAWQVGWDGTGMLRGQRLSWNAELTRVWRYVYTSFFGRVYEAQNRSIGYPSGPDARRVSVRLLWDPNADWQALARVTSTDQGENDLDEPYFPGTPKPDGSTFEGIVERSREIELGLRWWPAGGIDVAVRGAWRTTDNAGHVSGARTSDWLGTLELHLVR
jgi:hypothetical protein